MALLFDTDAKTIRKHIHNIINENEVEKESNTQKMRVANSDKLVPFYSLDVIISVGYRVKSQNGIVFRKWANNILKDYLLKGYAINERHYQDIDYVTKILNEYKLAGGRLPSSESMLEFLTAYQRGFKILDDYDHHSLVFPKGEKKAYVINYNECIKLIHETMFSDKGDQFAIEKNESFNSSISTIY